MTSSFAEDPAYAGLIRRFIAGMPERIREIECAVDASDVDRLRVVAHQLKGAAPGYGFETIGAAAGAVEAGIEGHAPASIEHVRDDVRVLIERCRSTLPGQGANAA